MSHLEFQKEDVKSTPFQMSPRRSKYYDVENVLKQRTYDADDNLVSALNQFDVIYRALCGILYNFVPRSGHPGGSISSGPIVESLLFGGMDYDFNQPDRKDNDYVCYAAGHKALGLYALWALRNECVQVARPDLLPEEKYQLRLEDLLGFRRNPSNKTPLYKKFHAKPLDGHPTPVVPFVKIATGASGVGFTTGVGTALGALDTYGKNAPWCHLIEGEGGMTPGRVMESMATAASSQLRNIVAHFDWNQSSIDSDQVCREGNTPGEYVQWTPADMSYVNEWNVVNVPDGRDFRQILAAQYIATKTIDNDLPTAIVYRTTKGYKYGIEGAASHGAGHAFCSKEFYGFLEEFQKEFGHSFPQLQGEKTPENVEKTFYDFLNVIRDVLKENKDTAQILTETIIESRTRLNSSKRQPRENGPAMENVYKNPELNPENVPTELRLEPGKSVTLRGVLGNTFCYLNKVSNGAFIGSAADLFGSTSISNLAKGISEGYFNGTENPSARLIKVGGICEDAMGGVMSGLAAFGNHVGVGSSYGAFIAALQHVPARLHAIGQEARKHAFGDEYNPFVIVCAHAGPRTGEDGPTHADPQPLQLLQENFPKDAMITLTPWDTQEIWPLVIAALKARPSVIAPFVTRPEEEVLDRKALGLPPAHMAAQGLYALRQADQKSKKYHGTLILQGNAVGHHFAKDVLPEIDKQGLNMNIYYVSSAELFNRLPEAERERIFPEKLGREAMGITEFTLSTMYRWVTSNEGRKRTLHTFRSGHFAGSGQAEAVLHEAGLDGPAQLSAITDYARFIEKL